MPVHAPEKQFPDIFSVVACHLSRLSLFVGHWDVNLDTYTGRHGIAAQQIVDTGYEMQPVDNVHIAIVSI